MRRPLAALTATLLLLTVSACGDEEEPKAEPETLTGVEVSGDVGKEPSVETTDKFKADGTQSAELEVGDGDELAQDAVIEAKVAVFDNDGKLVQGNYDGEQTERIDLAAAQAPWLGELVGAHIGSRVGVALPVDDVVGPQGAPQAGLDPGEPMLFLVDIVEEAEPPLEGPQGESVDPPGDAPKVVADGDKVSALDFSDAPKNPPSKLQVIPLVEGEGAEVEEGQNLTVNYFGAVWGKGEKPFDSSFERGEPASFQLAKGSLIDGWVKALPGVKVGSRVMLVIPPELGYGKAGSGENIPGNATLVFVIDVLGAS